jgi:RNA polymerase sigma-54 factor
MTPDHDDRRRAYCERRTWGDSSHGTVVPYAHFFTPSLRIKDVLKEVVEREGKPLTDNQILDRLNDKGIHIARRTVCKYRMALAILPSPLR